MLEYPKNVNYSQSRMWTKADTATATAVVGITEDLVEEIGEILSIDLPLTGDELDMDTLCIHLHLQNHIHHLASPLSGRVLEINRDVLDNPNLLHIAPFNNWLYRMEFDEPDELDFLMSAAQYGSFLDSI